jgi:hypothetical protein
VQRQARRGRRKRCGRLARRPSTAVGAELACTQGVRSVLEPRHVRTAPAGPCPGRRFRSAESCLPSRRADGLQDGTGAQERPAGPRAAGRLRAADRLVRVVVPFFVAGTSAMHLDDARPTS